MKLVLFLITFLASAMVSWGYNIAVENDDGVTIYYNYSDDGKELIVNTCGYGYYSGNVELV